MWDSELSLECLHAGIRYQDWTLDDCLKNLQHPYSVQIKLMLLVKCDKLLQYLLFSVILFEETNAEGKLD